MFIHVELKLFKNRKNRKTDNTAAWQFWQLPNKNTQTDSAATKFNSVPSRNPSCASVHTVCQRQESLSVIKHDWYRIVYTHARTHSQCDGSTGAAGTTTKQASMPTGKEGHGVFHACCCHRIARMARIFIDVFMAEQKPVAGKFHSKWLITHGKGCQTAQFYFRHNAPTLAI